MIDKRTSNKQAITRRAFILGAGKLGLLFLLAGRMFYMQFLKKDDYKTLSDKNRIKIIILAPSRGEILDADNQVVVKNNSCFRLSFDKNTQVKFGSELDLISEILEFNQEQQIEIKKRIKNASNRLPVVIIDYLDWRQISLIEERRLELKSFFIDTGFERDYKFAESMAHITGYLGRSVNNENLDPVIVKNFKVGQTGVEYYYEELLRGNFGHKQVEINARGKYIRELKNTDAVAGKNLLLNIDANLQEKAMSYLNPQGSSAIVMNCNNGNILVSASTPSYDPNKFNKLSSKYWDRINSDVYKPLTDKTIRDIYPPGSAFKIITILAALEFGVDPKMKVNCSGGPFLGGNKFRCSKLSGHGLLNMRDALKYSCNSYMYSVAKQIGAEKIIEVARKFGFGSKTNIDLPRELSGFVPSPEWKRRVYNSKWTLGDTLNLSIGQGFLSATPMQLARMIAAVANGGKLLTPKIAYIEDKDKIEYTQIDIKKENLDIVKDALYYAVNSPGGTGYSSRLDSRALYMSGKTGTAQVQAKKNANDNLSRDDIAWKSRNHAIFAGFAPHDNPEYISLVYYDHGGGGGRSAAPIAKKIMQDVFRKHGKMV